MRKRSRTVSAETRGNPFMLKRLYNIQEPIRFAAVINASPESFHGQSVSAGGDAIALAVERAEENGAALVDIGAMSTAPYKEVRITEAEEVRRMEQAVTAARRVTDLPISVDTQRLAVARAGLDAGADLVNDVSGLLADPAVGTLCAQRDCGMILMANDDPGLDEEDEPPAHVIHRLLEQAMVRAEEAGVDRGKIILDPGIGFFRHRSLAWHDWDTEVLRHLGVLKSLGRPLMIGASRKSFIGHLLGRPDPNDRLAGSLAVAAYCRRQGVNWLRVHDPAETRDLLKMMDILEWED